MAQNRKTYLQYDLGDVLAWPANEIRAHILTEDGWRWESGHKERDAHVPCDVHEAHTYVSVVFKFEYNMD